MATPRFLPIVLALAAAAAACPADRGEEPAPPDPPALEFDSAAVRVETASDTILLTVELAGSEEQRRRGLMYRDSLADGAGMLFLYDDEQAADHGFWMYHTRIPLDIAYLDADGRIVAIRTMEPCESPYSVDCPGYSPGVPWRNALEVRAGWFGHRGVAVGDRVVGVPAAGEEPGAAEPARPGE
jgi:uncharacterized membrane protein (UPF0127 family)